MSTSNRSEDSLKHRLQNGDRLVGQLVRMPCEPLIEIGAAAGMDLVLLDGEHGPADGVALYHHVALARSRGLRVLVRIGRQGHDDVLRALEAGADGIVAPHIESASQAREVVKHSHFPPLGDRGFAQYGQAGDWGSVPAAEQLENARTDTLVVVMLETELGIAAADEVLAVDGVDAVMAGPADLSVSLGLTGGAAEPAVADAVAQVEQAARRRDRHIVSVVGDMERARAAQSGILVWNAAKLLVEQYAAAVAASRS